MTTGRDWLSTWMISAQTGLSRRQLGNWEKAGLLEARRSPVLSPETFYNLDQVLYVAARQCMMGRLRTRLRCDIPARTLLLAADSLGVSLWLPPIHGHLMRSLPTENLT